MYSSHCSMFAAAKVKEEPLHEASPVVLLSLPPVQTLTDDERTALELQECNPDRCNEELRKLSEEALAEGVRVPDGWRCSRHLRITGRQKGKAYTQYHDPQGAMYRSKACARTRLGLKSVTITTNSKDKSFKQEPQQIQQGKVVEASSSAYRLLAELTDADLPGYLKQVRITCSDPNSGIVKDGLWYPRLKQVECHTQCCVGKTFPERTMRCSGQNSFEAHCGRSYKQSRWKQSFKVNKQGFTGMSVERYMEQHGIKLTKPKKSSSPLQQPSAPLVSTQSLHARTTPEPAMAALASASLPCQRSVLQGSCEADLEEEEEDSQQQDPPQVLATSAARAYNERPRRSCSVPPVDPCVYDGDGDDDDDMLPTLAEPNEADIAANDDMMPMFDEPIEQMQQEDAPGDEMVDSESGDDTEPGRTSPEVHQNEGYVSNRYTSIVGCLKIKQAKLNRDHKNQLRNLRRRLKKREDELQALQQQLARQHTNAHPVAKEQEPKGQQANDSAVSAEAVPGPSHQGEEQCACCKEKEASVANLERELADACAQCQQHREGQQRASAEYASLLQENTNLKTQMYNLRVLGNGKD